MREHNWSAEGITLNLSKLLKISPLPWLMHEEPVDAIDYIWKELAEYRAHWGKSPDAFFIPIGNSTVFGIPLKHPKEEKEIKIKKRPHYY